MQENTIMDRKAFNKMAFGIAVPIMIQNLINALVNSADTIMLSYVSQDAMAASSLAGQLQLILMMTIYGFSTGAAVLGAQYWGKKDYTTIERVLGLAMRLAMSIVLLFFLAAFLAPGTIMTIFTNEQAIIKEGTVYLRILSFSYLFNGFSQIYLAVQRSVERVKLPTITYAISLSINVVINAVFIFGLLGAPKLGLVGVAIGTVVARLIELLICLGHSAKMKIVKFRTRYVFAKSGVLMKDLLNVSIPSMINDLAWSVAYSMYSVIMGHLGGGAVAANAVAVMVRNIGAVACRGAAGATTIIIGKTLGANNIEGAKVYAKRMSMMTSLLAIGGGVVIIALRPAILWLYSDKLTAEALSFLGAMILMQTYHLWGEAMNTCWICGCFRGGGDAKFGMYLDTFSMWCIALPLMAIAAFWLKLPVVWVYFVMCLDEFEKMIPVYIHYRRFKWLKNITRNKEELEVN